MLNMWIQLKRTVHWLGFDWDDREYYASDYFGNLYNFAIELIQKGLAYVVCQRACRYNIRSERDPSSTRY